MKTQVILPEAAVFSKQSSVDLYLPEKKRKENLYFFYCLQYDSKSCWFILVHEFRVFRLFCSPLLKLVVCSRTSCWYISFQSSLLHSYIEHYIIQHVSGEKLQKDVKLCMLEHLGFTVFKELLLAPESVFPLFYICQNYFFC